MNARDEQWAGETSALKIGSGFVALNEGTLRVSKSLSKVWTCQIIQHRSFGFGRLLWRPDVHFDKVSQISMMRGLLGRSSKRSWAGEMDVMFQGPVNLSMLCPWALVGVSLGIAGLYFSSFSRFTGCNRLLLIGESISSRSPQDYVGSLIDSAGRLLVTVGLMAA